MRNHYAVAVGFPSRTCRGPGVVSFEIESIDQVGTTLVSRKGTRFGPMHAIRALYMANGFPDDVAPVYGFVRAGTGVLNRRFAHWLKQTAPPRKPAGFTERQGQYLAFTHAYTKINGRPPAEAGMRKYFRVIPPIVYQMVR